MCRSSAQFNLGYVDKSTQGLRMATEDAEISMLCRHTQANQLQMCSCGGS
jgi:hypothetical protein